MMDRDHLCIRNGSRRVNGIFILSTFFVALALLLIILPSCGFSNIPRAPRVKIEIMVIESSPAKVYILACGAHPDGCLRKYNVIQKRDGNTFYVTLNTYARTGVPCATVITPFERIIELDVAGLEAGTYTVDVNGTRDTFKLETDNFLKE